MSTNCKTTNRTPGLDLREHILVPQPFDPAGLHQLKSATPARIGIWRAGPRYKTASLLRFWADHAAAQDAVFSDVSDTLLGDLGLFTVQTRATSRHEHLAHPDLGRRLCAEAVAIIRERCQPQSPVQIVLSDGLSSAAIEANAGAILPALIDALDTQGLKVGTPFFVKYGRERVEDEIGEILGATVVCMLIGERPGLATAESMSAYIIYRPTLRSIESDRTVVSNIHRHGLPPVEAGAHVASLVKKMIEFQASGTKLADLLGSTG